MKPVSHHCRAAVLGTISGKAGQKFIKFGLHRLGYQPLGSLAKHRAQKIASLFWPAKLNYRILTHGGVTPCWLLKPISTIEFQQVTPPPSTHSRTPDSVIPPQGLLDKAKHYYELRNKLIHERATVSITDTDVDNYRETIEQVLATLFGLKF